MKGTSDGWGCSCVGWWSVERSCRVSRVALPYIGARGAGVGGRIELSRWLIL